MSDPAPVVALFDLDGTLLRHHGNGDHAMVTAGRRVVGPNFHMNGVDYAGRLDGAIWRQAAAINGLGDADADRLEPDFKTAYVAAFAESFERGARTQALPGAADLVAALQAAGVVIGVLTGNWQATGREKLRQAGYELNDFRATAWGDDATHRRALPGVALRPWTGGVPEHPAMRRAVVIGDTPHDVDCGRVAGCRTLAVCTGPSYDREHLEEAAPDRIVPDLTACRDLVTWILDDAR